MSFRQSIIVCATALLAWLAIPPPASAQEHQPAAGEHQPAQSPQQPVADAHQPAAAEEHPAEAEHGEGVWPTIARLFNFALLVGVLAYFLRAPIAGYLASRGQQIRSDLVEASSMRGAAESQLAEIERRMKALPGELEALRARGAQEVAAEEVRIRTAAEAERDRLLQQMRREIDLRVRIARRQLTEEAAALAVGVARERIARRITAEDQIRLIDRYTSQLGAAR